ncbi:MAG: O-succinylbenzoate synthase, partial [Leifsonia sp.]
ALPELSYDCGLATVGLFEYDVAVEPLVAVDGAIDVRRVEVNERVFADYGAGMERDAWWRARLERCYTRLVTESPASL